MRTLGETSDARVMAISRVSGVRRTSTATPTPASTVGRVWMGCVVLCVPARLASEVGTGVH